MVNWRIIKINLLVLLALLCIAELCLHLLFSFSNNSKFKVYASYQQLQKNSAGLQYLPHRYLGYALSPNWQKGKNRHNAHGFRGEEIKEKTSGTLRIVCIGGSTTYTTALEDYRLSYPFLLEQNLKQNGFDHVEVINAGVGNWSTYESFINLQMRLFELEPDMLVIYHATNDIQSRMVWVWSLGCS